MTQVDQRFCLSSKLSMQLGRTTSWSPKANVFTAPKMRLLQWPFCQTSTALTKRSAFASQQNGRIPENTVADSISPAPPACCHLCQSTILFGIVWVLLSPAFAAWCGWGADLLRHYWRDAFFCVCVGSGSFCHDWTLHCSVLLVFWCVVCLWTAPSFAPLDSQRINKKGTLYLGRDLGTDPG